MRALTRMRTLAAACALLLFVSGMAAAFDKQIDRSGGPSPPPTTQAGEPDTGHELVTILFFRQVFLVRIPVWHWTVFSAQSANWYRLGTRR